MPDIWAFINEFTDTDEEGNGSAMRVSTVGWVFDAISKKVLEILPKEFVSLTEAFSLKYRKQ